MATTIGPDHGQFAWHRVRDLIGQPYASPQVRGLFAHTGLDPDDLLTENRVGIYSMPPHDRQPCPVKEIDLTPSYRVRLRFRHARLVVGAAAVPPPTLVFTGITYFLENDHDLVPFAAGLPADIRPTDDVEAIIGRMGSRPSGFHFEPGEETGYMVWEDRNPIVHILFRGHDQLPLRITVYLAPSGDAV